MFKKIKNIFFVFTFLVIGVFTLLKVHAAITLDPVLNFAKVQVNTTYDDTATSIVLVGGDGSKLPNPSADGNFNLVWWNATDYPDPSDDAFVEIVRVTARSTDTLTITRPSAGNNYNGEGSNNTAKKHNISGKIYLMALGPTKKMMDDIATNSISDHGALTGLLDNDHTQYFNDISDTSSLDLTLTGQSISGAVLPSGINHGGLAGLSDDDHPQYVLTNGDTMIGELNVNFDPAGDNLATFTAGGTSSSSATVGGAVNINNTLNDREGLVIYSNNNATASAAQLRLETDDPNYDSGHLRINSTSAGGADYDIRIDSPNPEIEFVDTDEVSPAGKFEFASQSDYFQFTGRNAGDTAFEGIMYLERVADGGRIGINDSTPDAMIDVVHTGSQDLLYLSSSSGANGDLLSFENNGTLSIGGWTNPDGTTGKIQLNSNATSPSGLDLANTIAIGTGTGGANATKKYLGQFGWVSRDGSFSAPKLVAYIGAEATETYGADVDTGSDMVFYVGTDNGTNPTEKVRITQGGTGIGTSSPRSVLDIVGGSGNSRGITLSSSIADATTKVGLLSVGHYLNSEEVITLFAIDSTATENNLSIGGGTNANASTEILFFTGSNNATITGTQRMNISSEGLVGINETLPDATFEVIPTKTTEQGIKVKGQSGQTADLFIATDVSDNIGFRVEADFDIIFGSGAVGKDYTMIFNGESNNGVFTWMEDESRLEFDSEISINTTTGAFLPPRMTTAQRDALTAVNGMIIYNSTTNAFNFYENSAWTTK